MTSYKISVPLRVHVGGKNPWFPLNLNRFRNSHFHVLNKAKKQFASEIALECSQMPCIERCHIHYTIYPMNKRMFDLDNPVSIQAKFFQDVLVETKRIIDDNYNIVVSSSNSFGSIDNDSPRCEIEIFPLKLNQYIKQVISEQGTKRI